MGEIRPVAPDRSGDRLARSPDARRSRAAATAAARRPQSSRPPPARPWGSRRACRRARHKVRSGPLLSGMPSPSSCGPSLCACVAALAELLRVAAVGIVGAGDERAELAAAQGQPAVAALRADAADRCRRRAADRARAQGTRRAPAVISRRLLVHDLAGLRLEVAPEVVEQFLPVEPPARDVVQLLLELGGVIVADVSSRRSARGRRSPAGRSPRERSGPSRPGHIRGPSASAGSTHRSTAAQCRVPPAA